MVGTYEARLAELSATSRLPETPDVDAAEQMVVEMHDRFLREDRGTLLERSPPGGET